MENTNENLSLFRILNQYCGKLITIGWIWTCHDEANVLCIKNLSFILKNVINLNGQICVIINGLNQPISFIGEKYAIVYIKNEKDEILYDNSKVLKQCPITCDYNEIAKLIEATFGKNIADEYTNSHCKCKK